MKQLLLCATLLVSSLSMAQHQKYTSPDPQQPPQGTPPTFPEDRQVPGQEPTPPLPPDEQAPPPRTLSTEEVQQQITSHLSSEPDLANTNLGAKVSDSSVVLTGNVTSEGQHDLALRIARSYAGDRKLVDKITVRQQT
jgi:hypothetical protein